VSGIMDMMANLGSLQDVGKQFGDFIELQRAALARIEAKQDEILSRLDTLERWARVEMETEDVL